MADVQTNRCSFTLGAAITSGTQTSVTRASATDGLPGDSNGPASGTYVFVMTDGTNYELARVTGGQGTTTLTIARAVEAIGGVQTALASVPNGTVCYAVLTAADVGGAPTIPSYDITVLAKLSLAPVAYWKLNDAVGSTTAADSSGNGYTLTKNGTVTFGEPSVVPSDSETSAQGDGSTGYLSAAAAFALIPTGNSACTIVLATTTPSSHQLADMVQVGEQGSTNSEQMVIGLSNSAGNGVGNYVNMWTGGVPVAYAPQVAGVSHLIGLCYDGAGDLIGFVDGALVGGAEGLTQSMTSAPPWLLRGYDGFSSWPLGRVAIFAGVLTPKDWALLMQAFTGV